MAGIREIDAMKSTDLAADQPATHKTTGARHAGGGRNKIKVKDQTLLPDLRSLVDSNTRVGPQSALLWTCKSWRHLADELKAKDHKVCHVVMGKLLTSQHCSLQANVKVLEGNQSPDRNAQFEHINASVTAAQHANQPVISVDTKKKELVDVFKNGGQEWLSSGEPVKVQIHDSINRDPGVPIHRGLMTLVQTLPG